MSAQEYYAAGPIPGPQPQPQSQYPPSASYHPPPASPPKDSSSPNMTYTGFQPQSVPQFNQTHPYQPPLNQSQPTFPPPPYHHEQRPSVHFTPQQLPTSTPPPRHSFSGQRPPPNQFLQPPTQPALAPAPSYPYHHANVSRPMHPQTQPYVNKHHAHSDAAFSGYNSDPEPHRRRHRHGGNTDRRRRISDTSRSTKTDAIIGATGGGIIGDLIFPGLGTVGGALAGWLGGKDYGERRKLRESQLDRDQEEWERRFHRHNRHRSRSHSRTRQHS